MGRQGEMFEDGPARVTPEPRALLEAWDVRFGIRHPGQRYFFARGRDARVLKQLHQTFGWPLLLQLMDDFFASEDPFIREAGHTIAVFASQANKLAQRRSTLQQPLAERSLMLAAFDRLDEADARRRP